MAEEEQSISKKTGLSAAYKKGASCFRRLYWGDGHGLSLMSTVKSHLSLNTPRTYGTSINADLQQLNKQMNCYS